MRDSWIQETRQTLSTLDTAENRIPTPRSKEQQVFNNEEPGIRDKAAEENQKSAGQGINNIATTGDVQKRTGQVMSKSLIHKLVNKQLDANEINVEFNENLGGIDMDEESTTQIFQKVARLGDLSPRHSERGKSLGKKRKNKQKDNTNVQPVGVQTRRTISKYNNL